MSTEKNTTAQKVLRMFNDGQALEAFEAALDWADTVREASEYSIYRFEDMSSVRVYITDEHEIAVIEE